MKTKFLLIPLLIMLAACTEEGDDLNQWMMETKKSAKPKPPEVFEPAVRTPYQDPPNISPNAFDVHRMRPPEAERAKLRNAPDLNRPKELLENFALSELKFVGVIGSGSRLSGLIEQGGHVYTVHPGNHMGKDYGRITRITADEITLIETVEQADGGWKRKQTTVIPSVDMEATEQKVDQ